MAPEAVTHSPTHPLTHSPTHPLTHSPTHPLTHSPTHPLTHSPTHPLTHSPTHPLTHSPTHPLTHSPPFGYELQQLPLRRVGHEIQQPVRPLLHVADARLAIGEQMLFAHDARAVEHQTH